VRGLTKTKPVALLLSNGQRTVHSTMFGKKLEHSWSGHALFSAPNLCTGHNDVHIDVSIMQPIFLSAWWCWRRRLVNPFWGCLDDIRFVVTGRNRISRRRVPCFERSAAAWCGLVRSTDVARSVAGRATAFRRSSPTVSTNT
jgi:hypothetical protein